jgi:thiamine biosynthesis lipoprotein
MRHPFPSKRLRIVLGTWVAIEAMAADADEELSAIEAAYAVIGAVATRMHPTRPGSDLAAINSAPLHTPVEVQPDTWHLLKLAQRLYAATEGVFDPCLPSSPGRLPDVEIGSEEEDEEPTVICHAPVCLDLGGIAKGHAIDRAIATLSAQGCVSGLVNAGGDLRVFGDRKDTILLRRGTQFHPMDLENSALAVSDLDATERPEEHQGYYRRVSPDCDSLGRIGLGRVGGSAADSVGEVGRAIPTTERRYAAVIAQEAVIADALTKCVLLCPSDLAARALREFAAQSV